MVDSDEDEDADLKAERARLGAGTSDHLVVTGLTKEFPTTSGEAATYRKAHSYACSVPPNTVVKNLTFGVPRGQCFGLLGVNGAGKVSDPTTTTTTTFFLCALP